MALIYWRESTKVKEYETSQAWPFPVALFGPADPLTYDPSNPGDGSPINSGNPIPVAVIGEAVNQAARRIVTSGFTAAAAGDYAAGDIMSDSVTDTAGQPMFFAGVVSAAGQVAILDKVVAKCSEDAVLARLTLHFYWEQPTAAEVEMDDNVAADFAKTAAGRNKYVGSVPLAALADMGTAMAMSTTGSLREMLKTSPASTGLWCVVQINDAEANETANMTLSFDTYWLN